MSFDLRPCDAKRRDGLATRASLSLSLSLLFSVFANPPLELERDNRRLVISLGSDAAAGSDLLVVLLMRPTTLVATLRFLRGGSHTAGRPQTLLELQQLPHEVQVRADDWPRVLHKFVRLHHRQALVPHYVRDRDRRAARHSCLTVH